MSANQVIVSESKTIVSVNETTNEVTVVQAAPNRVEVILTTAISSGGGSAAWGDITGTLSNQTDLQNELDDKENLSNKATDFSTINNTLYPSVQAVQNQILATILSGSTFMFSGTNSDISGYESMPIISSFTAGVLSTKSASVTTSPTLIEEFATATNYPNITILPAGLFTCHFESQKSAGSNNYHCFFELYKRSSGGSETLLLTSDNSRASALNTIIQQTVTGYSSSNIILLATDRLVVKIYAQMTSSTATITIQYDDNTDARLSLPSSPLGYVPENVANKSTDVALGTSDTLYPSQAAVKSYVDTGLATKEPTITTLPISKGGTNSGTALNNNRVMKSSSGKIIESSAITASRALVSDVNGIPTHATTTSTEIGFVNGVTSAIQTQLNGKEATITTLSIAKGGTNSGTALNNNRVMRSSAGAIGEAAAITASRALISDANGIPTHSSVTSTELGYVSGVTSALQTQLNAKAARTQTEYVSIYIETVQEKTYKLIVKIPYACVIANTITICESGTCTAAVQIDGVSVGSSNSVSTTEEDRTQSSANNVSANNDIQLRITSNADCIGLSLTIKFTRTLDA